MKVDLKNSIGSILYSHKQTDYVTPHTHEKYEIVYYLKGKGLTTVYGENIYNFKYEDDCILLIPPNVKHDEYSATETQIICNLLNLNEEVEGTYFFKISQKTEEIFGRIKKKMLYINRLYHKCKYEKDENLLRETEVAVESLSPDVYRLLAENKNYRGGYLADVVNAVKKYIKNNFTQKINYDILASEFGYSYGRFRHIFMEYTGMTLYSYQQSLRLNYAKQLIAVSEKSMNEIASKVGINGSVRFCNWFKESVGTTPLKYRKMNQMLKWGAVWNLTDLIKKHKTANMIIDTDLGCDCDDAAAIAIANVLHREKLVNILCITHCLGDEDAARCIDYINCYYGNDFPIGKSENCPFDATKYLERYVYKMKDDFDKSKRIGNSVELMKEKLSAAEKGSVKMVFIGQLNNLAALLNDETGRKLVYDKVESIVIMAGNFEQTGEYFDYKTYRYMAEFNVALDINGAKRVVEEKELPLKFIDFNQGIKVFAGGVLKGFDKNPVSRIYKTFGVENRESWDLLTVLYAILGSGGMFAASNEGKVNIDDKGRTTFTEGGGKHTILTLVNPKDATEQINNLLLKIREVR